MRLIFACVVGWFVLAVASAFEASDGAGLSAPKHDRPGEKSGSLIVAVLQARP